VAILEWLEPFYVAGHWVPEMIEIAGGKDVLGRKRTPSFRVSAEDVMDAAPEILLIAQCGYSAQQARDEYRAMPFPEEWSAMPAVRNSRVYALDASGYFSRPGPRLITGIEALAKILHPEVVVSPEAESIAVPIGGMLLPARSPSVRAASAN
jgi:iron complex transport system substrate-binding protein